MAKTGLLVATNPATIGCVLPIIRKHVQNTLYIQYSPSHHKKLESGEQIVTPSYYGQDVIGIYSQTNAFSLNFDVRVLLSGFRHPLLSIINTKKKVEVVFFDQCYTSDEMANFVQSFISNATPSCQTINLFRSPENSKSRNNVCQSQQLIESITNTNKSWQGDVHKMYDNVVLGGTFDRLHAGHKILLSESILHCNKKLSVGVTDTSMLKSKKLWELIEPCSRRICLVQDFLSDVEPRLQYNVVPISDPFGPTKDDPELELIVVSSETVNGGIKVNDVRLQNGLQPLNILTVKLLEDSMPEHEHEEAKMSSSNSRLRLLGTRLRTPEIKPNLPRRPYIIGLTGGIASGKSSTVKYLTALGAGVVDYNTLAHKLFSKGQACYNLLVQQFGETILNKEAEIDKKAIIFNDKENVEKMNSLIWPVMLQHATTEIQRLHKAGHQIVILEAAMLRQAGWDQHCHETWACIIPPEEALRRMQNCNGWSTSESEARLSSQPSNVEFVDHAHVVLCSAWDPKFTQYQVEKAWIQLQAFLEENGKT